MAERACLFGTYARRHSANRLLRATLEARMLGADDDDSDRADAEAVQDRLGDKYRPPRPATSDKKPD